MVTNATPVTIDFTGEIQGYFVGNHSPFLDALSTLSTRQVTGSITYDTAVGPAPNFSTPSDYSQGELQPGEWVTSALSWAGGTHAVTQVAGQRYFDMVRFFDNTPLGLDEIQIGDYESTCCTSDGFFSVNSLGISIAGFNIISPGNSGASSFFVPDLASFAGGVGAFESSTTDASGVTGYSGYFRILTASARTTSVPEPGSLLLLVAGLAGAGLLGRRRSKAA